MKFKGKIVNWNDQKGFGFVEASAGGERAFVHIKSFKQKGKRPVLGDLIIYRQVLDRTNRFVAKDIRFAKAKAGYKSAKPKRIFAPIFTLIFCLLVIFSIILEKLPTLVGYAYVVMSSIAFIAYAIDKSAARSGRWRTRESTLHLLALLGGWPGAFFAQNILRHKSSKAEFKSVYRFTVLLNVAFFIWLLTDNGQGYLSKII